MPPQRMNGEENRWQYNFNGSAPLPFASRVTVINSVATSVALVPGAAIATALAVRHHVCKTDRPGDTFFLG
ncbi:MAG: hypothetical protein IH859_01415 [Chloroflexi bacterium]|nr:hypothetical protein [Chloroflexota bacterium]